MGKYIPLRILIAMVIGIVLSHYFSFDIFKTEITLLVCLFLILILYHYYKTKLLRIAYIIINFIFFTTLGLYLNESKEDINNNSHYSKITVSDLSISSIEIEKLIKGSHYYNKYWVQIKQIDDYKCNGRLILLIPKKDSVKIAVGDRLQTIFRVKKINKPLNSYEFDYSKYLKQFGINESMLLENNNYILQGINNYNIIYKFRRLNTYIRGKLQEASIGKREKEVIEALVLGYRNDISKELKNKYIDSGLMHLLAISGLHIGVLLMSFTWVLNMLRLNKTMKMIILLISIWFFALLSGLSTSVLRSVIMFTFVTISFLYKRKSNIYQSLIMAAILLLMFNTRYLFSVGFQLSFIAVFFIVWLQPKIYNKWQPKNIILKYIWRISTVSISAQIGVLPLSLYYFHQFPVHFLLGNIVLLPFIPIVLAMGIVVVILLSLELPSWYIVYVYDLLIYYVNEFVYLLADSGMFVIKNIKFDFTMIILTYLLIFILGYLLVQIRTNKLIL
ncbi:MAG: ComEC/Rec2 family competence protein, partial [Flavobacteriaceae bacterium]|nr:ComEC/Rec2 family competence protein [Flavobacteriaceae bacterium]